MLSINWSDVISIMDLLKVYLIVFAVLLVLAIVVTIAVRKRRTPIKKFVRRQSWIAMLMAVVVILNLVCFGPMSTMISLATGNGSIEEETLEESSALSEEIAAEGIVMMENDDNLLPLINNNTINVFGWSSTNPCYGGTGSGSMNDDYAIVSLLEGLNNAGLETNTGLSDFYTAYREARPEIGMWAQDFTLPEPTVDSYSDELMEDSKDFSDVAMVVVSRVGGEHYDLPRDMSKVTYENNSEDYNDFEAGEHYLQLSQSEEDLVAYVCENFDNVILVCNSANVMELGIADDYDQIKSVIWCPGMGQSGFNALGKILTGEVNPSGKSADTFVYDLTQSPSWNNFGSFTYDNMDEFQISEDDAFMPNALPTFVNYVEGIYVGYRYYETAAAEGLIDYGSTVQYPFGHGLSYTSFEQEMGGLQVSDGSISFDVTVTNTGDVTGKDVVEVYYNPPYENGGVEKSAANLVAYDKTESLEPGESEVITITFSAEDMASYDTYGEGSYILDAGDYAISINSDSHTVLDSETYTVDAKIVYDESNPRSTDGTAAVNQFAVSEGTENIYLSRADGFANYEEAVAAPTSFSMSEEDKANFVNNSNFDVNDYTDEADEMPATGADNGLELADLRGAEYDDERWDALLDELTVSEMTDMIALGGYSTAEASGIVKVRTTDCDGPAAINNNFTGVGSIAMPSNVVLANTWNTDLSLKFGQSIGAMADQMNVSGWYAPSTNIHRNALAGRNFEYYSEDGFLAGTMVANSVQGAKEYGVYSYVKHFALNEQETNRWSMLCSWSTEQAVRENYLKPFEIAVKQGGAEAIMSSYNYIGPTWAGAHNGLLNNVLRGEWGFKGMVLTDYFANFGYMDAERSILNGGTFCLSTYDTGSNYIVDTDNPTVVKAMRQASKDILYTVVNSRAYVPANLQTGLLNWQIMAIAIDVLLAGIIVILEVFAIKGFKKDNVNTLVVEDVFEGV